MLDLTFSLFGVHTIGVARFCGVSTRGLESRVPVTMPWVRVILREGCPLSGHTSLTQNPESEPSQRSVMPEQGGLIIANPKAYWWLVLKAGI